MLVFALVELGLHISQSRAKMHPDDWTAVRAALESQVDPADLVVVAPLWLDQVGRMNLGNELMTAERVARADESRFPVAHEVGLGSSRSPALTGWPVEQEQRFGDLHVRKLRNPDYRPVIDDLVRHVDGARLLVATARETKEEACTWNLGKVITGNLGFGPAVSANRYQCARSMWVGETVFADLAYVPRRCIHAPPPRGKGVTRLRFQDVRFGTRLEGHHTLYVEAERHLGTPVRIAFFLDGNQIGEAVHEDGQGWIPFGFDTPEMQGKTGEIVAEISSEKGYHRVYCFEATTR